VHQIPDVPGEIAMHAQVESRRTFLRHTAIAGLGVSTLARKSFATPEGDTYFAGAAEREITPPEGMEITHYIRENIGAHDPLFVRALVLRDRHGKQLALVSADAIGAGFATCDEIRNRIKADCGIDEVWFSCSHTHSGRWILSTPTPGRKYTEELWWDDGTHVALTDRPEELAWNTAVHKRIVDAVRQAQSRLEPADLKTGRAPVKVGINRRITGPDGFTYMGWNREGLIVPWVSTLSAHSKKTQQPIFVLFEHAAHPVTVPHTSKLVSADFPGAAVATIRKEVPHECIVAFGQGCSANINSFPLRTTHEDAQAAGMKLGAAALVAVGKSNSISGSTIHAKTIPTLLPTMPLPSESMVESQLKAQRDHPDRIKQLKKIDAYRATGQAPPPRRLDAHGVMLGKEFCLVALPFEHFSHTERWVDQQSPFGNTMVFTLTNGGRGYIGSDQGLAMGANGGYEAGSMPNWSAHEVMSPNLGPPAVGSEQIIQGAIAALWA